MVSVYQIKAFFYGVIRTGQAIAESMRIYKNFDMDLSLLST